MTSETEAAKGHISAKLVNQPLQDALKVPHLYDISYPTITVGPAKPMAKIDRSDAGVKARMALMARRAAAAAKTRESLRTFKQAKYKNAKYGKRAAR